MRYFLEAKYDNRKSFYEKAVIEENEKEIVLFSFNVKVAKINKIEGHIYNIEIYNTQSATTIRHIKEFAKQFDFGVYTTEDLKKMEIKNHGKI